MGYVYSMKLLLQRFHYEPEYTLGKLYVDGVYQCFVLEDTLREVKIQDETAIPAGNYRVIISVSPRFGKEYPRLLDVPGFDGVLIHSGNNSKDTSGCLLVGTNWDGTDTITGSRVAYMQLFLKIQEAFKKEEITIEIKNSSWFITN
jgi:hypothetical protein